MDCIVRSSIGSASKIFPFSLGSIILFYCAYPAILCVNQGGFFIYGNITGTLSAQFLGSTLFGFYVRI